MNGFIKISVSSIDNDDFNYVFEASNNRCKTILEFYGYKEDFKLIGDKLSVFPKNINDVAIFEVGQDERRFAYYLLIKAFCYDQSGHSALKIIVDNMSDTPNGHRSEFSILSEPSAINLLGQKLKNWNPVDSKEIIWESHQS